MGQITYTNKQDNTSGDIGKVVAADMNQIKSVVNTNFGQLNSQGANIRNFIKKARDYRAGRNLTAAPTVVIFGDSITGGSWSESFKTYLIDNYNIPTDNIQIMWFGGYSIYDMAPSLDSNLIHPNWDLVVFNENEWANRLGDLDDSYLWRIEQTIKRIRENTTSDIMLGTWSMRGSTMSDLYNGVITYEDLISMEDYEFFNWYRDIGIKYNCEVVDFNQAIVNYVLEGNDPTGQYNGVHWSAGTWYFDVFLPEIIRHIEASDYQTALNFPYPLGYKEEIIYFAEQFDWDFFKNQKVTLNGGWNDAHGTSSVGSGVGGDNIVINAKNIIGFEVYWETPLNSRTMDITIDDGTGYAAPSTLTPFGRVMEYCTDIVSLTYAGNAQAWRMKRPKECANPLATFGDNKSTPTRFTLVITSVTLSGSDQIVEFEIRDSGGSVIGSGYSPTDDITIGNLNFPIRANGETNYFLQDADGTFPASSDSNFVVGDEYEFYVKSNWIDSFDLFSDGNSAFVFGLEPGDYDVKLTANTSNQRIIGIRLLHS